MTGHVFAVTSYETKTVFSIEVQDNPTIQRDVYNDAGYDSPVFTIYIHTVVIIAFDNLHQTSPCLSWVCTEKSVNFLDNNNNYWLYMYLCKHFQLLFPAYLPMYSHLVSLYIHIYINTNIYIQILYIYNIYVYTYIRVLSIVWFEWWVSIAIFGGHLI